MKRCFRLWPGLMHKLWLVPSTVLLWALSPVKLPIGLVSNLVCYSPLNHTAMAYFTHDGDNRHQSKSQWCQSSGSDIVDLNETSSKKARLFFGPSTCWFGYALVFRHMPLIRWIGPTKIPSIKLITTKSRITFNIAYWRDLRWNAASVYLNYA